MFPRLCRLSCIALLAVISLQSQSLASLNEAGALLSPITLTPKSCRGAFRYAARDGNNDVVTISVVHIFDADRRLYGCRSRSRVVDGGQQRCITCSLLSREITS